MSVLSPALIDEEPLRLQVQGGPASLDIDWNRDLFVDDQPPAVRFAVTSRPAYPTFGLCAILRRPTDPVEAIAECHIITGSNREIANLVINRTLERVEKLSPSSRKSLAAAVSQRWTEIKRNDIRGKHRHHSIHVSAANRIYEYVNQLSDGMKIFFPTGDCHLYAQAKCGILQ